MTCPPELVAILASFGIAVAAAGEPLEPSIILAPAGARFHFSGPAYQAPFSVDGLDSAAGSVMAGLASCKALAVEAHMLCLHGAAAVIGGRGYLFLAPFGAGKSSLMAELSALGAAILADDVVLLDTRRMSICGLRLPPRLRRAFVGAASPRMKGWIAARSILDGPRYTYLAPGGLTPGPHDLTDIVLLNRVDDAALQAEPVLEPALPGVMIPRLLWHNMSRHHAPSSIAAMVSGLATGLRCSILHAASMAQAAERLLDGSLQARPGRGHPPLSSTRRDDLQIIRTDRGAIISDDQSGRIFEINESAYVMLRLLQTLDDDDEVMDMLRGVYPDVPEADLRAQLSASARQFAGCGLVDFARAPAREADPERV